MRLEKKKNLWNKCILERQEFNMVILIYNELYKFFHRKVIYIIFIIIFVVCLLNNILFKINYNEDGVYEKDKGDLSQEIYDLSSKLSKLDGLEYVNTKTSLELLKIKKDYEIDSFQYIMTDIYFYDIVYNINYYSYINIDNDMVVRYEKIYNEYVDRFKNNDNMSFIKEELDNILETYDSNSIDIEILNLRLDKGIDYGNTYLNRALDDYYQTKIGLKDYEDKDLEWTDMIVYNDLIEKNNIDKYIIDNKVNLSKDNDLRGCLKTIVEDYYVFLVVVIALTTSLLVGEDFSKGTIKLLLIKPYKRNKILLSKYITCIIVLLIVILFLIFCELWIGWVVFGSDSLSIPIVVYDFIEKSLKEYNVFVYMVKRTIYTLPKLLMILNITFMVSTVFMSSLLSSICCFSLYLFSDLIIGYLKNYKITKYLVFSNWDFLTYINGNISKYFNINIYFSIMVYLVYWVLIFWVLFVIFKKRDIKNI